MKKFWKKYRLNRQSKKKQRKRSLRSRNKDSMFVCEIQTAQRRYKSLLLNIRVKINGRRKIIRDNYCRDQYFLDNNNNNNNKQRREKFT